MTPFEYLSVLISIILGLGLTHLLSAVRELIQKRARVRFYWLALVWAALIFTTQVQWWWGIFELRVRPAWNFFSFLFLLLAPVSMYLTAGIVLPDLEGDEKCDLKEYYYRNHGWIFGLTAIGNLLDAGRAYMAVASAADPKVWTNLIGVALCISLAVIRSERYHVVITLLLTTIFLSFIIMARLNMV
jgi:hypothetical protein